ncbi:MAG TPA: hypothetical protein VEL31_29800 [Ktedonobacteraceae bacterium]|nr:hypothetical protein [Ktedonobacteraceae bacterium]
MRALSNVAKQRAFASAPQYDVVIVGAGPYGLSTAAYTLEKGLRTAIFGKPLNLWRKHMLNNQFESSIPGLYFVGFSAVSSCGSLYRFVVGTKAAAQRVVSSVARHTRVHGGKNYA